MAASPWPLRGSGIDTQVRSVAIVHVQSRVVAMLRVPAPPVGVNDEGELLASIEHRSAVVGAATEVEVFVDVQADVTSNRESATAVEESRPGTECVPPSQMHLLCQGLAPAGSGTGRAAAGRETENV
jgi:hypothetical protein